MKKMLCYSMIPILIFTGCEIGAAPKPTPKPQVTELSNVTYELHTLEEEGISLTTLGTEPHAVRSAVTWVANELVLNASNTYKDPFTDVDVDLVLTNGTVTYKIPGFWDGDNVWRVRFVCPTAGDWTYETVCTNASDAGLHGVKGALTCTEYQGNLAVYKHGFVQTTSDKRYFTYADGTPFFYLGDTHWSLGGEDADMVQRMTDQRMKQGFTVIQSQPLDGRFSLENGINRSDIKGLANYDKLFQIIASHGLTHANAEFFFVNEMENAIKNMGGYSDKTVGSQTLNDKTYTFYDLSDKAKAYLERVSRFWVARYSAYPVMWTLAQECDAGCYWDESPSRGWCKLNNPYKYVAAYMSKYDPYKHPLTAHQENNFHTVASTSSFRDVPEHSWWSVQWQQGYNEAIRTIYPADYYENGQGKPTVLYEGRYCYLWTKNFGARAQGYTAFLSGMCGYGWGGHDTWSYKNTYDEGNDSDKDGVDIITSAEKKAATYNDSLEYSSSYQVGYMRAFFETIVDNWYDLVPRFDDSQFLKRDDQAYGIISTTDNGSKGVCYFYQTANNDLMQKPNAATSEIASHTGTLGNLKRNADYGYIWFDPVDGKTIENGTFHTTADGTHEIGPKIDKDMVYYFYLIK